MTPGDTQALQDLRQTATFQRERGNYFGAGYAMEQAALAAWGDPNEMNSCALAAVEDYRRVYESGAPCDLPVLVSILLIARLYWRHYLFKPSTTAHTQQANELLGELAQRLVTCFKASNGRDNYLVRGVIVETDFDSRFETELPDFEVNWNTTSGGPQGMRFNLPSAFTLFRYLGDYDLARQVIEVCPTAFTSPGLRGWRAAVEGIVDPKTAPERFSEAADAFAEDLQPNSDEELQRKGGVWDSMNLTTWAPHFRVRSLLATAVRDPGHVRELIVRAAQSADPNAGGRGAPNVRRLSLLVQSLANLLSPESVVNIEEVRRQFLTVAQIGGADEADEVAIRFVTLAAEAFDGFRLNPATEITTGRLRDALDALRRLPLLEPGLSEAVEPVTGEHAVYLAQSEIRTWMHRTLESITDERQLQRIIYRLCQASIPFYAQVLHGPLEYGKDVVVYFEQDGIRILRMYQAKVGDISLSKWQETRPQLEEIFLVALPDFVVPADPAPRKEGILICNGHAGAYAFPSMQGWFDSQRRDHGREFSFMSVDHIVTWIVQKHLVGDFRAALRDLGSPIDIG